MNDNFYGFDYGYNYEKKIKAFDSVRSHGNKVGIGVLSFISLTNIIAFILQLFGVNEFIQRNEILVECFDIIFSTTAIFVPFLIVMYNVRKTHNDDSFGFNKPYDKKMFLYAISAGLMLCLVSDRIVSFIVSFISAFGLSVESVQSTTPTSPLGFLLYLVSSAVVAPLIEEFAIRGVALQPLRKYGDKFAIIVSSLVFGLMHQNFVQAVFAFTTGLIIGYFTVSTGSVWCGVIIHALNNFFAVITNSVSEELPHITIYFVYSILPLLIYSLGIVSIIIFLKEKNRYKLMPPQVQCISTKEKTKAFLLSGPMLVAIILMVLKTFSYISIAG